MDDIPNTKKKGTQANLKKVLGVRYLYRHAGGYFYGKKKNKKGVIVPIVLKTENDERVYDLKIAEKAVREWADGLDAPAKIAPLAFGELYEKFLATKAGNADGTQEQYAWAKGVFERYNGIQLWNTSVKDIKASDLSAFFGQLPKEWKANTYNSFTLIVKEIFQVAVVDEVIRINYYDIITNSRRKVISNPEIIPSARQCRLIIDNIRSQKYADTSEASADKLEFLYQAGVGEAEANKMTWAQVDFKNGFINFPKRVKTGVAFNVPFYPELEPFINGLYEKHGKPNGSKKVFDVKTVKEAIYNACDRLKVFRCSPRKFRKARITALYRDGIDPKTIAKWQGHKDGGILVMRTYSNTIDEDSAAFEALQVKKLFEKQKEKAA